MAWPAFLAFVARTGILHVSQPKKTVTTEPKVYPEPQVDRETTVVRGVCGAVLGAVFAIVIWMRCGGFGLAGSIILFAGSILVCTVGSIRHGDSFWYGLLRRRS